MSKHVCVFGMYKVCFMLCTPKDVCCVRGDVCFVLLCLFVLCSGVLFVFLVVVLYVLRCMSCC